MEKKIGEAGEKLAHRLRHLLRDGNRFLKSIPLLFLSFIKRKASDFTKRLHEFQEIGGILIHQVEEDGAGHIEYGKPDGIRLC